MWQNIDMLGNIKTVVIILCVWSRKTKIDIFLQMLLNIPLKNTRIIGFIYSVLTEVLAELQFQKNKQVFSISKYIN